VTEFYAITINSVLMITFFF